MLLIVIMLVIVIEFPEPPLVTRIAVRLRVALRTMRLVMKDRNLLPEGAFSLNRPNHAHGLLKCVGQYLRRVWLDLILGVRHP